MDNMRWTLFWPCWCNSIMAVVGTVPLVERPSVRERCYDSYQVHSIQGPLYQRNLGGLND